MTTISNGESGLSVRNKLNDIWAGLELNAIDTSKAVTAVDVFVYDTSKDSDGGAWRKRTQHTSWYNETLNTATRGSRREFPAVAVIVAEAAKVTIYDGDDPSLPMWMVFNLGGFNYYTVQNILGTSNSGTSVKSATMVNGDLVVGVGATAQSGVRIIKFVSDSAETNDGASPAVLLTDISDRNTDGVTKFGLSGADPIVNGTVNDVAMTVLPDAPIDPATGLPVPTIAVATAGGVSVIKDDGTVVDITGAIAESVSLTDDRLVFSQGSTNFEIVNFGAMPSADEAVTAWRDLYYRAGTAFGALNLLPNATVPILVEGSSNDLALGCSGGLNVLKENIATPANGMVAFLTSTYNTGWMNGDIKGAFLSDTDDTDLVGGTDADRSVNGNDLTVNGTITRTAVATGADLVAYSGLSASNYLEQPYNSDLDFGTGDFSIMGWMKQAANTAVETLLERDSAVSAQRFTLAVNASGFLTFTCDDDTTARTATSNRVVDNDVWTHFVALYDGAGDVKIYLNGVLDDTETGSALLTLNNASAVLRVGLAVDDAEPLANADLALLRISATVPSDSQIRKIYEDEKVLFQEGAQATLYGASNAVTALAHDSDAGLLHVGTSAGRSVFSGLRRVSNTTTAVGTAISASGSLVVEE